VQTEYEGVVNLISAAKNNGDVKKVCQQTFVNWKLYGCSTNRTYVFVKWVLPKDLHYEALPFFKSFSFSHLGFLFCCAVCVHYNNRPWVISSDHSITVLVSNSLIMVQQRCIVNKMHMLWSWTWCFSKLMTAVGSDSAQYLQYFTLCWNLNLIASTVIQEAASWVVSPKIWPWLHNSETWRFKKQQWSGM
jgi:hypothetical protein